MVKNKKKKEFKWSPIIIPIASFFLLIFSSWLLTNNPELFMEIEPIVDGENCCTVNGFGAMEKVAGGLIIVYKTDCGEIIKKETSNVYEVGDIVCRP